MHATLLRNHDEAPTRSGHDQDRSRNMRTRNRRLGPLVQHPPPPLPGRHHTTTSRKSTHNNTKGSGLNKPPQNPGLDTPAKGHCTRYVALHPLRGAAPVTWRCTRTEGVQCLRIGCTTPVTSSRTCPNGGQRTRRAPGTGTAELGGALKRRARGSRCVARAAPNRSAGHTYNQPGRGAHIRRGRGQSRPRAQPTPAS